MFREGRLVQKSKRCCESMHVFSIIFPLFLLWKIHAKSREKRANGYLYEHRQQITFGTTFWSKKKSNFWIPCGFPVASQDMTGASQNSLFFF